MSDLAHDPDALRSGCPKCGGALQAGVVVERAPNGDRESHPSHWIEGDPPPAADAHGEWWTDRTHRPIEAMRCTACGYLEFYTL